MSITEKHILFDNPFDSDAAGHLHTNSVPPKTRNASLAKICEPFKDEVLHKFCAANAGLDFSSTGIRYLKALVGNASQAVLVTAFGFNQVVPTPSREAIGGELSQPALTNLTKHSRDKASGLTADSKNMDNSPVQIWQEFLDRPLIKVWFAQNMMASHPKLHAFPKGVMTQKAFEVAAFRDRIRAEGAPEKSSILLVNFGNSFSWIREQVIFKARLVWPFATVLPPMMLQRSAETHAVYGRMQVDEAFYRLLMRFRFVLSPPGAGWDCYRTWEALYFGTIPIILKSGTVFDRMYENLPVLLVDDLNQVTEKLLEDTWNTYATRSFQMEKLSADYWINRISRIAMKGNSHIVLPAH
eukprot:gnl/TRDRNA2_/TRDRNA2_31751_c0_seq1.p1 gnl/TRDRNA2_/TRDRNA2_31751_c0~~gnl/TRDRNA2_/TRDRNA2_31751_c0_seq1.p1  ORF type:complete len:355 (-),score=45.97 gnl/TRDRNA2_/TRDRNA2_31751_c0_seq1:45-1109(-)